MPLTKTEARKIALATPGASEGPYFGKPAIFVGEDYLCRVHDKEAALVLRSGSMEMREVMLEAEPKLFYITEHYRNFPVILARLSALDKKTMKELLAARLLRLAQKAAKKRPRRTARKIAKKKKA
jgi:hypothetical protein